MANPNQIKIHLSISPPPPPFPPSPSNPSSPSPSSLLHDLFLRRSPHRRRRRRQLTSPTDLPTPTPPPAFNSSYPYHPSRPFHLSHSSSSAACSAAVPPGPLLLPSSSRGCVRATTDPNLVSLSIPLPGHGVSLTPSLPLAAPSPGASSMP
ncbi:formin-like protein 13 [Dioscorea cayenensis subsp. rotundata]|uniref:Formin-like protein 13 n=1 Tax=Dioscorea cayennensis subsp. rotundata TaxID=55577 RepID=A0AB40CQS7_DIOCR|nr:formin-like protein 13 [Dioscorea cayenensis subsp. rotundata]